MEHVRYAFEFYQARQREIYSAELYNAALDPVIAGALALKEKFLAAHVNAPGTVLMFGAAESGLSTLATLGKGDLSISPFILQKRHIQSPLKNPSPTRVLYSHTVTCDPQANRCIEQCTYDHVEIALQGYLGQCALLKEVSSWGENGCTWYWLIPKAVASKTLLAYAA